MPLLVSLLLIAGLLFWVNRTPVKIASKGEPLVAVMVPPLSDSALAGAALFKDNCAACHGDNASGRKGAGPPLVHIIYEPNHHGDIAFQLAAKNGVRGHHWNFGNMPPVANVTEEGIVKIINYVRTLQRANGIN